MTSKELFEYEIKPLRLRLCNLEKEYKKLLREEQGGKKACCDSCARSCIVSIDGFGDEFCTFDKSVDDWCVNYIPENKFSKYLRENFHYDTKIFELLENAFGYNFLQRCENEEKLNLAKQFLDLLSEFKK